MCPVGSNANGGFGLSSVSQKSLSRSEALARWEQECFGTETEACIGVVLEGGTGGLPS